MAIITISREMGTGAYQIAKDVAKKLKYDLIDGLKIAELAPHYGLSHDIFQRVDEKPPVYLTTEDRILAAYLSTIELILLESVKKGNVIVYGRGGQDLLKGMHNVVRVKFVAPFDERVEKFAEREWIDPDLARELIRKSDHQRGGFIHFYFDRDWRNPLDYDVVVNTSRLSPGAIVESIVAAAKDPKLKEAEVESEEILDNLILCKKIEAELLKSGMIESTHFKIDAHGGEVFLSGHVHKEEEKDKAIKIISAISGVQQVNETLQVVSYSPYKE